MKKYLIIAGLAWIAATTGCAPVIIGGAAAGAYKVATDERTFGRMWDDSNISATIKADLSSDRLIKASNIDVDTVDGNVVLSGVVGSEAQAARAVEIAEKFEGVKSVTNNLQVGTKTIRDTLSDDMIVSKINARLIAEPGVRTMNIDVDAEKGVVTLTGVVYDASLKERILSIAEGTGGVVKVMDRIQVK